MTDSSPSTRQRLTGVRPMLLGISAVLTGGLLAIHQLILHQSGLPTQSPLAITLVQAGFGLTILGFLYGVLRDARTTNSAD